MMRTLTLGACAMMAVLLLSSEASACGRRGASSGATYYSSGTSYSGYGTAYDGTVPSYGYATTPSNAPAGYGYGGYDLGRPGYNPGGLGGPRSGLGVRPGMGFGGVGLRR